METFDASVSKLFIVSVTYPYGRYGYFEDVRHTETPDQTTERTLAYLLPTVLLLDSIEATIAGTRPERLG